MKIDKIVLRKMKIEFRTPFEISSVRMKEKHFIMTEVHSGDKVGYGDCSALYHPFYNEETTNTAWIILSDYLVPMVLDKEEIDHPEEVYDMFKSVKRNKMAKAALDCAIWDLYAKEKGITLSEALGGTKKKVETGVSIGIKESPEELLKYVDGFVDQGYNRIKIKIKPGKDIKYLEKIREKYPDVMLMADANSAYTLDDIELFKEMDKLNLIMIEQPLGHDDIVDHSKLQKAIKTRVCLDESIHSVDDARLAIELGSTKTINIKVARVGGLTAAKKIHDLCQEHDLPVWCGGMLDTGIARAHNVAITSLPNYKFPGDLPESTRYWEKDIIDPPMTIDEDSCIAVLDKPGIGYEPIKEMVDDMTYEIKEFTR
ncbi:O-succinylbenzoate synthase [Dethiosulfatibacter aminovorans DSM 17477]|uniref:o-succinylbenzoate synthase n=1 Tax=Dethiosulfatibacter aminovorans DSM 17477 TaxID=1121476 RepID=A0A1M6BZM7_9FIRM|nr:o-succinylbenzoate synthase [Dethiosulfatibacter aminovorans]SHI54190.1 O-succinylbenzoate synthase [Dethiosulfatibacter aminovorans DSM 17477]